MEWLKIGLVVLPTIMELMGLAERTFGSGTGEIKKEFVTEGARAVVKGVTAVSTGGQLDWWKKFGGSIGGVVDLLAGMLFPKDESNRSAEVDTSGIM